MRRVHPTAIALGTAFWCIAAPAGSQDAAVTARFQRFYARGVLGVGYGSFSSATSVGDLDVSGAGVMWNFAIGVHLVQSLAIHVDACAMTLVTPSVSVAGVERVVMDRADATSTTTIIGAGATWNHPGDHFWASVSGGAAVLAVEIPSTATTGSMTPSYGLTRFGWGLNLLAGYDWPLVYHWRAGVALHGIFSQVPDQPFMGSAPTWTNLGLGATLTIIDR